MDIAIRNCETFIILARSQIQIIKNDKSLSANEQAIKIAQEEEKIKVNTEKIKNLKKE